MNLIEVMEHSLDQESCIGIIMKKYFVLFTICTTVFAMLLVTIPVSAMLEIVDGDMQIGKPGEQLQEKLAVKLTNTEGTPIVDANIKFEEIDGLGTLSAESVATDTNGNASVYFTPDAERENIYSIVATHGEEHVAFVLLAIHTGIHSSEEQDIDLNNVHVKRALYYNGDFQRVNINELSKPLRVKVEDRNNNPLPGARVNFRTASEHILLFPPTAVSDASGNIAIRFRGNKTGAYTIIGQLEGTRSDSHYYRVGFLVHVNNPNSGPSTPDSPTPDSPTPDPSTPDPGSPTPDPKSPTPNPRSPTPNLRSLTPNPRSPTPNPRTPNTPPNGGYVVWLEEHDQGCQSGVIHSDYVYIDRENKRITFTGENGEVDPGDTVRPYIKVETGYTYEQASERAPEILNECPL